MQIARISGESLLISSLINNQDVGEARSFGVSEIHFSGYQDEFNWLLNYVATYGTEPTWDAFLQSFPSFRRSEHEDTRSAADMVLKDYGKRTLTEAMGEAMNLMQMGDITSAWSTVVKAEPRRATPKVKKLLTDMDFLDNWEADKFSVEVPYPTLQRYTGGIRPGNIWYLAARPGQGKTAHLCNIVLRAVLDGHRVKFYSLEMSEHEVRSRFHAAMANKMGFRDIDLNRLRDRSVDLHSYKTFLGELQDKLDDTGGYLDIHTPKDGVVSPGVVAASASEFNLNVIDYIGLCRADTGQRSVDDWRVAASISNDFKATAGSSNSAFLVAAQINRQGDSGTEPPKVSQLAQSDALGQDGDAVVTMRSMSHGVATSFLLDKNRHGIGGVKFYTQFDPNVGVYDEITADQAEDMVVMKEQL